MHIKRKILLTAGAGLLLLASACGPSSGNRQGSAKQAADSLLDAKDGAGGSAIAVTPETRIVSLNGTISEILAALGMEENIVGTDVTSTYPASMQEKPKVGHNRNISAEGVLSLQPDLILARTEELNTALRSQFETAGVRVVSYKQEYSAEGTRTLIRSE